MLKDKTITGIIGFNKDKFLIDLKNHPQVDLIKINDNKFIWENFYHRYIITKENNEFMVECKEWTIYLQMDEEKTIIHKAIEGNKTYKAERFLHKYINIISSMTCFYRSGLLN